MSRLIILFFVLVTSSALVLLKLGSKNNAFIEIISNKPSFNFSPLVISGIFLYGISFVLYTYLISKFDLGYIIPLTTALVYILIFIASFIIFKEQFSTVKILGIIFILVGLTFLNLKT